MVPKEIGNLVGLEFLGLYENMFTGIIPDSIGKFSELKYFYGYRNGIIGEISYSLGNLTQLIVLSLIDNLFGGEIAASLGNCIRLERLDLSMNRLSGTIPKEAIGIIPSSFRKLRRLQVLDVSHNNLSVPTKGVFDNISAFSVVGNESCGGIKALRLPDCPKEIRGADQTFKAECEALRKLRHLNLVQLITSCSSIDFQEYGMSMKISTNGDMYSYSIILMELFTGKRPTDNMFTGELSLATAKREELYGLGVLPGGNSFMVSSKVEVVDHIGIVPARGLKDVEIMRFKEWGCCFESIVLIGDESTVVVAVLIAAVGAQVLEGKQVAGLGLGDRQEE
ncbi:hypothetical protein F3Y22_tig00110328pilonHSYRG00105 [Hibiscus syriacus]|uniref:Uncharacterized protein n=1 Tax=Hibiscus syriacus TaxID=106335 RepID=A0A6A3B314_HIBSY|nr:hypothetical protein F3Y22_tig00110328pilonHSYRG00105 [Hibiscus syriacus]